MATSFFKILLILKKKMILNCQYVVMKSCNVEYSQREQEQQNNVAVFTDHNL